MSKKIFFYMLNISSILVSAINLFLVDAMRDVSIVIKMVLILSIIISASISILFSFKNTRQVTSRSLLFLNILTSIVIIGYVILAKYNMLKIFNSVYTFKEFILSTGSYGMIVFSLIQLLQVMFVPIPSMIIVLTGVVIYGPFLTSVLCVIAVLTGSMLSFTLGKTFGFRLVSWIVGRDNALKYASVLNKRGKFFLSIAFLMPLFPDDALCLIAGMTTMRYDEFLIIASITRPIGVICMSYFGGGYIIPFSGWGLYVWGVLLVIIVIAVVMIYKYQDKIENFIINKIYNYKKKTTR